MTDATRKRLSSLQEGELAEFVAVYQKFLDDPEERRKRPECFEFYRRMRDAYQEELNKRHAQ